jgi:imidazolonepropionase-like amidohydrolase
MTQVVLENARIFDGIHGECPQGMQVLVEDGLIREVSGGSLRTDKARVIDVGGRTLMPGLIDAHIHACASDVDPDRVLKHGEAYRTAFAARMLGHALKCGFTTVRDVGGGSYSLSRAISDGLIQSPRYFYAGRFLSMSGGHGDFRQPHEDGEACSCGTLTSLGRIANGVDEVIHAAREELRRGAHCVKIMASGGVASPTDPIWMNQYRDDEILAVVQETLERRTYTAAHCHPPSSIRRCAELGVRSIEHGTLIDDETARVVAGTPAYIVPTMVVTFALVELGRSLGFPAASQQKVQEVFQNALTGMDCMRRAGVRIGFGTDLLGKLYTQRCREFTLRREVFTPLEILRQATSITAELMMMQGRIGCIAPDAYADLLVVDGDPLEDISLLAADGAKLRLIMRGGELVKNELA